MKRTTAPYLLLIIYFSCLLVTCKKGKDVIELKGSWVESKEKKDTLDFESSSFMLRSGLELRSGNWLPKLGSGLYFYKLKQDSISLHYTLSSLFEPQNFIFKISDDKLYIGNFLNKSSSGQVLIFEKLK